MRTCGICVCWYLLLLPSPTQAQEAPPDLASEVARLVKELDANELARRQAAEQALVELGPEARTLLPPVTPRMAAEVKERIGRVRSVLEMAVATSIAKQSTVTLAGEMSLAEAFAAVEEQTGNRIEGYERSKTKTELALTSAGYWPVVDQLLDEAQLGINAFGGVANTLVATARPDYESPRSGHAAYAGVFRFEIQRVESVRDLRNPTINGMRLTLNIAWEPRVTPILIRQQRDQLHVVDDQGKTIETSSNRPTFTATPADFTMSETELVISCELPSRGASKIASLKGSLTALIPGSKETFEFEQISTARGVEKQTAGVVITLEQVRKNGDIYEVRMRARYENATEALRSNRGWVYNNEAYLLDPNGKRIEPASFNGGPGRDEVQLNYGFALPDTIDGHKFVYRTPAAMLRIPVEYELTDIALP